MRDDLEEELCNECGEVHYNTNKGIWHMINNPCSGNKNVYRIMGGRKMIELFKGLISRNYKDDIYSFNELMIFPHFKPMQNFKEATWVERNNYSLIRDLEVRRMKRLRAYIKLEDDFSYKY